MTKQEHNAAWKKRNPGWVRKDNKRYYESKRGKPVLYRMICPDGKYYVGHTQFVLAYRLAKHWSRKNSMLYKHCVANGWGRDEVNCEVVQSFSSVAEAESAEKQYLREHVRVAPNLLNLRSS